MKNQQKSEFGKIHHNVSLRKLNAWRIGGEAEHYFSPKTLEDCQNFLKQYPKDKDITWLGLGSNMLIRDQGVSGCVIHTLSGMRDKYYDKSRAMFYVQAGVPCCQLSRFVARNHHHKAEFLAGVPGTMGGALAMNAGAHGAELWEFVEAVDVINRAGEIIHVRASEYIVGYRHAYPKPERLDLQNTWFVAAYLKFPKGDMRTGLQKIGDLLAIRARTQPINQPSCGSVFRNPPQTYAAKLIEASGLKGHRVGKAEVSLKHANFIVNLGGASSSDVEQIITDIKDTVSNKYKYNLDLEVKIIGKEDL
jgi:UDP-N-acetylmuramate dehydrogenase